MLHHLAGMMLLLMAFAAPAAATDQSAMEETNCLMACDANQQNCGATGHVSAKHPSLAQSRRQETLMSRSLRPTANFSQIDPGIPAKERLR